MTLLGDLRTFIFAVLFFGFLVYDIEFGHALDKQTAITLLVTVLGAVGISVAHTAGVQSATTRDPNAPTQAPPPL